MEGRPIGKDDFHTNKIIAFTFYAFVVYFINNALKCPNYFWKAAVVCQFVHAKSLPPYDFLLHRETHLIHGASDGALLSMTFSLNTKLGC